MMPKLKVSTTKKGYKTTDKWAKTNFLLRDAELRSYIPLTRRFSREQLSKMLGAYSMVYVKPTFGQMGKGVMKVEKTADGTYKYQLKGTKRYFRTFEGLYRAIKKDTLGKTYIVQKGIHVLSYDGRPYDLRLVVQQTPSKRWEATGTVARVAYPGKIVTNGSQGGTILPAHQVLQPYTSASGSEHLLAKLNQIGINTMKRLHRHYPELKEIGLDIAIDRGLHPWILEVNTRPDHCPFAILQDQSMIRRIVYYGRHYGRRYRLKCNKAKSTL
ncbi:YheC/YheD family protein [Paenibacillus sp. GSMTC-2017]|uniref:YheC/YheD family protein n=1 Tax=Paenibacillus sp. GSMTC-2017 TaxID=2794350 RepID=UPI0018D94197|nr:YheC/YheD family protein [Paenibacillus sp. GSMTC-2017]MBH5318646.1 YheC/YheD family protein [Paenibacillus sp. GSMTC-2017]